MRTLSLRVRTAAAGLGLCAAAAAGAADIQIFTAPHFTGAEITLRGETPDVSGLGSFHEQAASLVLNGRWEVCTQPEYRGDCVVLGPGRYPTLAAPIHHRIGSLRPLGAVIAEQQQQRREERAAIEESRREQLRREDEMRREQLRRDERIALEQSRRDRPRYSQGALDLFPDREFRGRPVRMQRDAVSLDGIGDRAASLVIHSGTWELCSEPRFQGRCRTFEPGRYATLGRLEDRIASVRQVR
jgi:beta/gamma crystallin